MPVSESNWSAGPVVKFHLPLPTEAPGTSDTCKWGLQVLTVELCPPPSQESGSNDFPRGHHESKVSAGALKYLLSLPVGQQQGCCVLSLSGWLLEINVDPIIVVVVVSEGLG